MESQDGPIDLSYAQSPAPSRQVTKFDKALVIVVLLHESLLLLGAVSNLTMPSSFPPPGTLITKNAEFYLLCMYWSRRNLAIVLMAAMGVLAVVGAITATKRAPSFRLAKLYVVMAALVVLINFICDVVNLNRPSLTWETKPGFSTSISRSVFTINGTIPEMSLETLFLSVSMIALLILHRRWKRRQLQSPPFPVLADHKDKMGSADEQRVSQ